MDSTDTENPSAVWDSVSLWLPQRDESCDFWWQSTGPQLGALLFQAGYTTIQQYEGLMFHYHVVVPRLGPRPVPSSTPGESPYKWKSFIQDDFKPIEFSKLNYFIRFLIANTCFSSPISDLTFSFPISTRMPSESNFDFSFSSFPSTKLF